MNLALERVDEAARHLALPVARVSVEPTKTPVMDLLLKITGAYRLQALGIQTPRRIRVVRPQLSLKEHRIKIVLEMFLGMPMVAVEAAINAVGARTTHNNMRRRHSFSQWLFFMYVFSFHSISTEI